MQLVGAIHDSSTLDRLTRHFKASGPKMVIGYASVLCDLVACPSQDALSYASSQADRIENGDNNIFRRNDIITSNTPPEMVF